MAQGVHLPDSAPRLSVAGIPESGFFCLLWGSNPGPHGCTPNSLPTKPSPQSLKGSFQHCLVCQMPLATIPSCPSFSSLHSGPLVVVSTLPVTRDPWLELPEL